jgi:hypothetical protein
MNVPSIDSVSAAAGALRRLESRVCLDARICSLSQVSFGLEPASDGSGRCAHLLQRVGSSSTTAPSTSTVTSGTERRPYLRPARCRRDSRVRGRSVPAGPGRQVHARVMDCSRSPVAVPLTVRRPNAGRRYRASLRAGERCAPIAGGVTSLLSAGGPRRPSGRGPTLPDRRGRPHSLSAGRPAARYLRRHPGGGSATRSPETVNSPSVG